MRQITEVPKAKRGMLALSLPEVDGVLKVNTREKLLNEMDLAKLELENRSAEVVKFLDGIYKEDDLANAFETLNEFEKYKKEQETVYSKKT